MEDTKYGFGENPPYLLYSVESEGKTLWGLVDKDGKRLDAVFHRTDDNRFYCVPHEVVTFDPEEGFSLLAWYDILEEVRAMEEQSLHRELLLSRVPQKYKNMAAKFVDENPECIVRVFADIFEQCCGYSHGCRVVIATLIYPFLDRLRKAKHPLAIELKEDPSLSIIANFNERIAANPTEYAQYELDFLDFWEIKLSTALIAMKELLGFCPDDQARAALCWALIERIDEFE